MTVMMMQFELASVCKREKIAQVSLSAALLRPFSAASVLFLSSQFADGVEDGHGCGSAISSKRNACGKFVLFGTRLDAASGQSSSLSNLFLSRARDKAKAKPLNGFAAERCHESQGMHMASSSKRDSKLASLGEALGQA